MGERSSPAPPEKRSPCVRCGDLIPPRQQCPTCHYGTQGPEGAPLVVTLGLALGLLLGLGLLLWVLYW
jgi:hypothetical protein